MTLLSISGITLAGHFCEIRRIFHEDSGKSLFFKKKSFAYQKVDKSLGIFAWALRPRSPKDWAPQDWPACAQPDAMIGVAADGTPIAPATARGGGRPSTPEDRRTEIGSLTV